SCGTRFSLSSRRSALRISGELKRVISPAKSRTVTSPSWRVEIFIGGPKVTMILLPEEAAGCKGDGESNAKYTSRRPSCGASEKSVFPALVRMKETRKRLYEGQSQDPGEAALVKASKRALQSRAAVVLAAMATATSPVSKHERAMPRSTSLAEQQ